MEPSGAFAGGIQHGNDQRLGRGDIGDIHRQRDAGSYNVTASVGALTANFALTNLVGSAASMTATGGTPQSATINTAFASTLQATVKDAGNNPVPGVVVTFAAPPARSQRYIRERAHHGDYQCLGRRDLGGVHGERHGGRL